MPLFRTGFGFQSILTLVSWCILIVLVFMFINASLYRGRLRYRLINLAFILMQLHYMQVLAERIVPTWQCFAFLFMDVVISVSAVFLGITLKKYTKTNLTSLSIKESMDNLPMALCYYRDGFAPELVNEQMQNLSQQMFGTALLDADSFWGYIIAGNFQNTCTQLHGGNVPIVKMEDGRVWTFERKKINKYWEITAHDITKEWETGQIIEQETVKLRDRNFRLKSYNDSMTYYVREKEILNAKMTIHNELGQMLLLTKRYLAEGEAVIPLEELKSMWGVTISKTKGEIIKDESSDQLKMLLDTAKEVGINICLEGEVPTDKECRELFTLALHECLTNAIRHAEASVLTVDITRKEDNFYVVLKNNGKIPTEPIVEGGGLGGLRKRIEKAGGNMKLESIPEFALKIMLCPKKGEGVNGI